MKLLMTNSRSYKSAGNFAIYKKEVREMETFIYITAAMLITTFINITAAGYLTVKMAEFLWEKVKRL